MKINDEFLLLLGFAFQCKVTVPKMGVINDLYQAVSALTGAPHDQVTDFVL